jgi:hypothetical protein
MSQTEGEGILPQIDRRIAALGSAEKHLKRPSTISFAERRELSAKAAAALADLRARRAELEGGEEAAPGEEPPAAVQASLEEADRVLERIGAAQPSATNQRAAVRKGPGQNRRGAPGGMSSQNRPPDRVGE